MRLCCPVRCKDGRVVHGNVWCAATVIRRVAGGTAVMVGER